MHFASFIDQVLRNRRPKRVICDLDEYVGQTGGPIDF